MGAEGVLGRRLSSGFPRRELSTRKVQPKLRMSKKELTDLELDFEAYDIQKVN